MKKSALILTLALLLCGVFTLAACDSFFNGGLGQGNGGDDNTTYLHANTATRKRAVPTRVQDQNEDEIPYKLETCYKLCDYYVFQYYLGDVRNVPLSMDSAYQWNGGPATTYSYEITNTTAQSIESIAQNTIAHTVENNWSDNLTHEGHIGVETGFSEPISSAKLAMSVDLTISRSSLSGGSTSGATSSSESFSEAKSNTESVTQNTTFTFDDTCDHGYYRFGYFGDFDIFTVIVVDLEQKVFSIENQAYLFNTYRTLDYSPDGRFSNASDINKLTFDMQYLDYLEIPIDVYEQSSVPSVPDQPQQPTGDTVNYAGGEGTATTPYLIANVAHMSNISKNNAENTYFKLVNDIDFASHVFVSFESFNGVLDGNGYKLSNWSGQSSVTAGEFILSNNGTIKNLQIHNFSVNSSSGTNVINLVGAFIGSNYGKIENCKIESSSVVATHSYQTGTSDYLKTFSGVLVGYNQASGVISNCHAANSTVSCKTDIAPDKQSDGKGWAKAGAVAGGNAGKVISCMSTGNTVSTHVRGGKTWTFTKALLVATSAGVVGFNTESGLVEYCYAASNNLLTNTEVIVGTADEYDYSGQLVAQNAATVKDCYYIGSAIGKNEDGSSADRLTLAQSAEAILSNVQMTATYGWHRNADGEITPCNFDNL